MKNLYLLAFISLAITTPLSLKAQGEFSSAESSILNSLADHSDYLKVLTCSIEIQVLSEYAGKKNANSPDTFRPMDEECRVVVDTHYRKSGEIEYKIRKYDSDLPIENMSSIWLLRAPNSSGRITHLRSDPPFGVIVTPPGETSPRKPHTHISYTHNLSINRNSISFQPKYSISDPNVDINVHYTIDIPFEYLGAAAE